MKQPKAQQKVYRMTPRNFTPRPPTVADLGDSLGPTPRNNFFLISCSFQEFFYKIISWRPPRPPIDEGAPSPRKNLDLPLPYPHRSSPTRHPHRPHP